MGALKIYELWFDRALSPFTLYGSKVDELFTPYNLGLRTFSFCTLE